MKAHKLFANLNKPISFVLTIVLVSLCYLIFESRFIFYGALAPDEFVFARHIYEYTFHIPYLDFPPYKTILGYYLFSIPMFFSHSILGPIYYIKNEIALINTILILLASLWATKFFDRRAILLTLFAILLNGMFFIYSTDLRVDMLTSWAALFAMMAVMSNRFRLGGVLLSIAFLISQKAIWYIFAINGAMALCAIAQPASPYQWRQIFKLNVALTIPIIIYIAFWSAIAGPYNVLYNMFYEAYIQAGINVYLDGYLICWQAVLIRGALLFLLWPMTFFMLFTKPNEDKNYHQTFFIVICTAIALEFFIDYKQPFPYNFVFTVPALFLLYNQFFTWLIQQRNAPFRSSVQFATLPVIFTTFFYLFGIYVVMNILSLPMINYLVYGVVAALLGYLFYFKHQPRLRKASFNLFLSLFIVLAILYPLYRSFLTISELDGGYQRSMIEVAASILGKDDDYVAGIPFFYQKDQPIEGMKNLIEPAANYLKKPDEDTRKLLLPSLYLLTSTEEKVLADFEKYPVKLILDNYRFVIVPDGIKNYIETHYLPFYGSILLYAPQIAAGDQTFDLKFSGQYRLLGSAPITIDGTTYPANSIRPLTKGLHHTSSEKSFRLAFIPETISPMNPKYDKNQHLRMIKAIIA